MKPSRFDAWNFIHRNFAAQWFDGLPLGNGDLGALVMADHKTINIPLAKSDLWDERCDDGTGQRVGQVVIGRQLVRRPAEGQPHTCLELRILLAKPGEDRFDLVQRGLRRLARDGPPLHLQPARVGIAAQLPATLDDRRVQRGRAHHRVGRSRLQLAVEPFELVQHAPHADNRVTPLERPAAVRGVPASLDVEPREALVADTDLQIRRLGHNGGVRRPAGDERVGPDARVSTCSPPSRRRCRS